MANPRVVCFLEDLHHEQMVNALVRRVAADLGIPGSAVSIETRNASGGHPAAIGEFKRFAARFESGELARPDVIVLAVDSDCFPDMRRIDIQALRASLSGLTCVVLCVPDPYIERWYLLDLAALRAALGRSLPGALPRTCDKQYYKNKLEEIVDSSGFDALLGGYEFADLIAAEMDLYAVGQIEPELGRFVDDLRACLQQFQHGAAA